MSQTVAVDAYQSLSDIQHVLLRPDTYVGSTERGSRETQCYSPETQKITLKKVFQSQALEQLFLEIFGNAADNVIRSRESGLDPLQIDINVTDQWVTIRNYGMCMPVANNAEGIPIPHSTFGILRTSSNYDDSKARFYIGKNGIGAKATNIFSKTFMIECADPDRQLLYKQTWTNNMSQFTQPEITPYTGPGYTQVSYSPDFARFGVNGFDQEALEIYTAHCYEISYTCEIPIIMNGQRIYMESIQQYTEMFFPLTRKSSIVYKDPNGAYELCLVDTPDKGMAVSFVNGIITKLGGVHVDAAYKVVTKKIVDCLGKIVKGVKITKRDIVHHVSIFLTCRLNQPKFSSQTKETLKSPTPKIELPDNLLNGIRNWDLVKIIYEDIERKQMAQLKKGNGRRKKRIVLKGLEEANLAGGNQSARTTLILTEGESAASYPTIFISQVPNNLGRDFFGILPLHGKILNVITADFIQILENRDIKNIIETLGLQHEVDYLIESNFKKLRYGNLLIMPDADEDGKHILGLILVFFMKYFPQLIERGFVKFLRTPITRVTYGGQRYLFYTMSSFNRFKSQLPPGTKLGKDDVDYFKGLGTSEEHHVIEDYQNPRIVTFRRDRASQEKMLLAFDKGKESANQRKQWFAEWIEEDMFELENMQELDISTFIDKELIYFVEENIIRAVPEAMDGLKESQRKALFTALRELKTTGKMKLTHLANKASERTDYRHGEDSLTNTIVNMAQNFVGTNNLPYFEPRGDFGSRNKSKAAAGRYIFISRPAILAKIFRKEDDKLEKRIEGETGPIECESLFPILPMHLVNGVDGIGTAWSCRIPAHNPLDISLWLQQRLLQNLQPDQNHQLPVLRPWYKGYGGTITLSRDGFISEGIMEIQPDQSILITELPLGKSIHKYKEFLDKEEEDGRISGYLNRSGHKVVYFIIEKYLDGAPTTAKLKLKKNHSYNNMTVLYRDEHRRIHPRIYNDVGKLLQDFYTIRLAKYEERKRLTLEQIDQEIFELGEKARFILAVVNKELKIRNRPRTEIRAHMDQMRLDYKWMTKVRPDSFTLEGVAEIQREIENKREEKARIESIRPEQTWYNELEEFVTAYCRQEKVSRSTFESCNPPMVLEIGGTPKPIKKRKKKDTPIITVEQTRPQFEIVTE